MTMDRLAIAAAVTLTVLSGCASEGPKPLPPATTSETVRDRDTVERTDTVAMQAKVVSVDQKTRMVTLEGADGERTTFRADDRVKNLPQVRKGDMVTAVYQRALAARILKKGTAKPGEGEAEELYTAEPGQMPAAVGGELVKVVATITGIDKAKQEVTLKGPKGRTVAVYVKDPTVLDRVKKGDLVELTYTEAIAISVDRPEKR
jgi:predicted small lipoprotein YifL